jgi:hypothetical protein
MVTVFLKILYEINHQHYHQKGYRSSVQVIRISGF